MAGDRRGSHKSHALFGGKSHPFSAPNITTFLCEPKGQSPNSLSLSLFHNDNDNEDDEPEEEEEAQPWRPLEAVDTWRTRRPCESKTASSISSKGSTFLFIFFANFHFRFRFWVFVALNRIGPTALGFRASCSTTRRSTR